MVKETCPYCSSNDFLPDHVINCPACQRQVDAPNVRLARKATEKEALNLRVAKAEAETKARNCLNILSDFGNKVKSSRACVCRPLSELERLISKNTALYSSFHMQVGSQSRAPEDNEYDKARVPIDSYFFPNYYPSINFATLTLNDEGDTRYGEHTLVLKTDMISHRASLFECNTHTFYDKFNLSAKKDIPAGYRAAWADKDKLAQAKLYSKINADTKEKDYPGILFERGADKNGADFIEVHIHGEFNREAIEKISFGRTSRAVDALLIKDLKKELIKAGLGIEVTQLSQNNSEAA